MLLTKMQLEVEYGHVDNVFVFTVSRSICSLAFSIAYAIYDLLGHWNFKAVDHFLRMLCSLNSTH